VAAWVAERDLAEVVTEFEKAQAAVAPIYDVRDVLADPQYQALDTITTVDDPDFGPLRMQNVLFRLSRTPGAIRWTGRAKGADNDDVYGQLLGLTAQERARLSEENVI
ncbi:MAG TPA: CoA transferase, partial [Rugosimonospora sp.]|nr:CoA transferase [Rugosimonospora sp.]